MQVLIPLASGCEEMEAVILIDVLRRAGWQVTMAALESGVVEASRGVRLIADQIWDEIEMDQQEALILPGGVSGYSTTVCPCWCSGRVEAIFARRSLGRFDLCGCLGPS